MKSITPRGYVCGFTEKPPVIDGRLDAALIVELPGRISGCNCSAPGAARLDYSMPPSTSNARVTEPS